MEHFICEVIKPIKRRSIRTALNKNKSMNKVLSVHTTAEQCLYQFLRDGKCYNGQNPYACEEFKQRAEGIDLDQITTELKDRLHDSLVLKYREQAERNKVANSTDAEEVFTGWIPFPPMGEDRNRVSPDGVVSYVWFDPKLDKVTKTRKIKTQGTKLRQVAVGGGRVSKKAPKSLCTKCGSWVQYPHDPEKITVICWLCVAKEVLEYANKKPDTKKGRINGRTKNNKLSNGIVRNGSVRHGRKTTGKVEKRKKSAPRKTVEKPKGVFRGGPDKMVDGP